MRVLFCFPQGDRMASHLPRVARNACCCYWCHMSRRTELAVIETCCTHRANGQQCFPNASLFGYYVLHHLTSIVIGSEYLSLILSQSCLCPSCPARHLCCRERVPPPPSPPSLELEVLLLYQNVRRSLSTMALRKCPDRPLKITGDSSAAHQQPWHPPP